MNLKNSTSAALTLLMLCGCGTLCGGKNENAIRRVEGRFSEPVELKLSGNVSTPITNHLLKVNANLYVPEDAGEDWVDNSLNVRAGRALFDYRLKREVGPDPFSGEYIPDMPSGTLREVAELQDPESGRSLIVSTSARRFRLTAAEGRLTMSVNEAAAVTEFRELKRRTLCFAPPFTEGAVLQREMPVSIFGRARPGAEVAVVFRGHEVRGKAGADGRWLVTLPAMAAAKDPATLVIESEGERCEVREVRVGEVWLAAGQSNMELPLCGKNTRFRDGQGRLITAMTRRDETVRYVHATTFTTAEKPLADLNVVWAPVCREYLEGHLYISALATLFEREIHAALDVPVGIIASHWGGTQIEPWTPDGPWAKMKKSKAPYPQQCSHRLFNATFAPLAPYTVRGMIWYQGEANASQNEVYTERMHELYNGYSAVFRNPELKLIFAQLAPYDYGKGKPTNRSLTGLQDAQSRFAAENPNAFMAVTVDVADPSDIHPNNKRTVARRFAALALKHCYGWKDLAADSPTVKNAVCDADGKVTLTFENGGKMYSYAPDHSPAGGFELKDADGVWHPAKAVNEGKGGTEGIFGNGVIELVAEGVKAPVEVGYLRKYPFKGTVYNGGDLPLGTFVRPVGK